MKVHIFYDNIFSHETQKFTSGGVQTYLLNLIDILKKYDKEINFYQLYKFDGNHTYQNVNIYSVKGKYKKITKNNVIRRFVKNKINNEDIVIFLDERLIFKTKSKKMIAIQHGIYWDESTNTNKSNLKKQIIKFLNLIIRYKDTRKYKYLNKLVLVDYNYLNWLRTIKNNVFMNNIVVIPNSVIVKDFDKVINPQIRIIFARRFVEKRGVIMFSNIAERLLLENKNIEICFAGRGELFDYIKNKFNNNSRVVIDNYDSEESIDYHKNFEIAVVPTLYSEGTSFSLLEAMAAKCAVVATNVGGMTNIIIDNFNGLLVNPTEEDLYNAINQLINDKDLRKKLSENAFDTVKTGFNFINWKDKWIKIFDELIITFEEKK